MNRSFFNLAILALGITLGATTTLIGAGAPDLSPEAVNRLFTSVGFTTGAVRDIEGSRIRVKSIRVEAKDKWLVIHILPERVN